MEKERGKKGKGKGKKKERKLKEGGKKIYNIQYICVWSNVHRCTSQKKERKIKRNKRSKQINTSS